MKRIGLALPAGRPDGRGLLALDLALQLRLRDLRPMVLDLTDRPATDPLSARLLDPVLDDAERTRTLIARNPGRELPFPVLHLLGERLQASPTMAQCPGRPDIGMAFFTHADIPEAHLARAAALPMVVAASSWHARVLRERGLGNVLNALPGVDPALFHPAPRHGVFRDRFALFCGGPLSYRKGHDLLLAAFRIFAQRHPEALLVCPWGDAAPEAPERLAASAHLEGMPARQDGRLQLAPWLERNRISPSAVVDLGTVPHAHMAAILRECDLAIFAGRATHGVPRTAMEALACGVPTVLPANTGHLDLIGDHAFMLRQQTDLAQITGDESLTGWGESSVDELLEVMETAFRQRARATAKSESAVRFMQAHHVTGYAERLLSAIGRIERGKPVAPAPGNEDYRWGLCLHRGRQYAAAQSVYDAILAHTPDHVGARMDRGHVRRELGDNAGAEADFRAVLQARPDQPQALQCLGILLQRQGKVEAAIASLRHALEGADTPSLHWDLAWALLLAGHYRAAWPHFEYRHAALGLRTPGPDKPRWDGRPVADGTLLVLDEQGLGDTLQFLRFLPLIPRGPGGRIIFAGKPATLSVVRRILPEGDVFDWDQPLPRSQAWVPLMSLPGCLGVMSVEDVCPPYAGTLVDEGRIAHWRARVRDEDDRPVVGLCWRGNPDYVADAARSPGLAPLRPILDVAGVRFVALQVGPGRQEIAELGLGHTLHDVGGEIEAAGADVLDTLAVLASCDYVISSCTSMVHMTGIARRPGQVLLSTRPGWFWMTERTDSPWYPTLDLVRQPAPGDWDSVARDSAARLAAWVADTTPGHRTPA